MPLCDVCLVYFDKKGVQCTDVLEHSIDLDYCNIRHWRTFLSDFIKRNKDSFAYLVIKPIYAPNTLLFPESSV